MATAVAEAEQAGGPAGATPQAIAAEQGQERGRAAEELATGEGLAAGPGEGLAAEPGEGHGPELAAEEQGQGQVQVFEEQAGEAPADGAAPSAADSEGEQLGQEQDWGPDVALA